VLIVERAFWRFTLATALTSGRLKARHIVLIGKPSSLARSAVTELNQQGLRISKHIAIPHRQDQETASIAAVVAETLAYVRGSQIEEIFVSAGIDRLASVTAI